MNSADALKSDLDRLLRPYLRWHYGPFPDGLPELPGRDALVAVVYTEPIYVGCTTCNRSHVFGSLYTYNSQFRTIEIGIITTSVRATYSLVSVGIDYIVAYAVIPPISKDYADKAVTRIIKLTTNRPPPHDF